MNHHIRRFVPMCVALCLVALLSTAMAIPMPKALSNQPVATINAEDNMTTMPANFQGAMVTNTTGMTH